MVWCYYLYLPAGLKIVGIPPVLVYQKLTYWFVKIQTLTVKVAWCPCVLGTTAHFGYMPSFLTFSTN